MTTKDQERKALAQIKQIVESLGEDSYIATALDGALELAQENIDNDWASSARHFIDKCHKHDDDVRKIKSDADAVERRLNEVIKGHERQIEDLTVALQTARGENCTRAQEITQVKEKLDAANREIIRLKAKLFDLMHPDF